jgi:putative peptidoglycan lipid II flippase
MASIVVSRLTGYLRTTLIPNVFQNKMETDALYMSFTITNFIYTLLVGGAISAALIPVLTSYIVKNDEEEGWRAASTFINVVFLLLILICVLGFIFAPIIINILAPSFDINQKFLSVKLMRILFPSITFLTLAGLVGGILNSYKKFAQAAFGPAIYNLGCALSIYFIGSKWGIVNAVYGIMASSFIYFLFQFLSAISYFKNYKFQILLNHEGFLRFVKLAIPSFIASSITQVNVIVSSYFTAGLGKHGNLTAYSNASDTWQLPYGIFAMGLGIALLPTLSENAANENFDEFRNILLKSLRATILLIVPCVTIFLIIPEPLVSVLFKWSNGVNVHLTGQILMFFTLALFSQSLLAIINRAFYSLNDTKTPLFIGSISIAVNLAISYSLLYFSNKLSLNLGAEYMALSYSISSSVCAYILFKLLNNRIKLVNTIELKLFVKKILFSAVIMGIILFILRLVTPIDFNVTKLNAHSKMLTGIFTLMLITFSSLAYSATLYKLKIPELYNLTSYILSKTGFRASK